MNMVNVEISNVTELQAMENDLAGDYVLVNDIDASATSGWNDGAGFDPIGDSTNRFTGTFDGQRYTISDLYINRPSTDRIGLFGDVDGNVESVKMIDGEITGKHYVGLLGGFIGGHCNNIKVSGIVSGEDDVGGVAGRFSRYSTHRRLYSEVNVSGNDKIGGITGSNGRGRIIDSYATGNVNGNEDVGGIVGYATNSWDIIRNTYSMGNVTGVSNVGALIGRLVDSELGYSFANSDINPSLDLIGSITGSASVVDSSLKTTEEMQFIGLYVDVDWSIELTTDETILYPQLGWDDEGVDSTWYIYHYQSTAIYNWQDLHAIRYDLSENYTLMNDLTPDTDYYDDYNNESTSGWLPIGTNANRFVGTLDGGGHIIEGLFINRIGEPNGGLFGVLEGSHVFDLYLKDVNINTGDDGTTTGTGGVVGRMVIGTIVERCRVSGSIVGDVNVGGIVGYAWGGDGFIYNCYNNANISGNENVGGIAGRFRRRWIQQTYSTGTINGTTNVGALVGLLDISTGSNITHSFWNKTLSGVEVAVGDTDGVTPMTFEVSIEQMTSYDDIYFESFYQKFDFLIDEIWKPSIWNDDGTGNVGYPALSWETPIEPTLKLYDNTYDGIKWYSHEVDNIELRIDGGDWMETSSPYLPDLNGLGDEYLIEVKGTSIGGEVTDTKMLVGNWDYYEPPHKSTIVIESDDGPGDTVFEQLAPLFDFYNESVTVMANVLSLGTTTAEMMQELAINHDIQAHCPYHYGRSPRDILSIGDDYINVSSPVNFAMIQHALDDGYTGVHIEIFDEINSEKRYVIDREDDNGISKMILNSSLEHEYGEDAKYVLTADEFDRIAQREKNRFIGLGLDEPKHFAWPGGYSSSLPDPQLDVQLEHYQTITWPRIGTANVYTSPMSRKIQRHNYLDEPTNHEAIDNTLLRVKEGGDLFFMIGHAPWMDYTTVEYIIQQCQAMDIQILTRNEAWTEFRYKVYDVYPAKNLELPSATTPTLELKVNDSMESTEIKVDFYKADGTFLGTDTVAHGGVATCNWDGTIDAGCVFKWYAVISASEEKQTEVFMFNTGVPYKYVSERKLSRKSLRSLLGIWRK